MFKEELQRAILSVGKALKGLTRLLSKAFSCGRRTVGYRDSGIKIQSVEDFFEYAFSEDPAVRAQTFNILEQQCQARLKRLRLPEEFHPSNSSFEHDEQEIAMQNLRDLLEGFYPTFSGRWNPVNLLVLDLMHDRRRFKQIQDQFYGVVLINLVAAREVLQDLFSGTDKRTLSLFQNFALLAASLLRVEHSGILYTRILKEASILAISDLFNYSRYLQRKEAEVAKIYALSEACEFCPSVTVQSVFSFILLREFSTEFFFRLEALGFSYIQDSHKLRAVATLFEQLLIKVEGLKSFPALTPTISTVCEKLDGFLSLPEFRKVKTIVDRIQQPPSEGSN